MLERTTLLAALLLGGSLLAPDAAALGRSETGSLELSAAPAAVAVTPAPEALASAQRARGSSGSRAGARPQSGGSRGSARPSGGQRSGGSRPSPSTSGSSRGRSSPAPASSSRGRSVAPPRSSSPRPSAPAPTHPSVSPGSSVRPSRSAPSPYVSPSTPAGEASAPRSVGSSSGGFPSSQGAPSGLDTRYSPTGSGQTPTSAGSPGSGVSNGHPSGEGTAAGLIDLRSARSAPRVRFPAPYRPAGSSRGTAGERGTPPSLVDPPPSDGPRTGGGPRPTSGPSHGPAVGGSGLDGGRRTSTPGPASLRGLAPRPGDDGPGADGGPRRPTLGGAGQDGPRLSGGSRGKLGRAEYSAGPTGRTRPGGERPVGERPAGERSGGSGGGLRPVGLDDARPRGRVAPRPDDHGRGHGHHHGHGHGYYGPGYWYGYGSGYCSPWGYWYGSGLSFWWGYGYHGHHWGWWYWPFYLSCWTPIWYTHTQVVYVEDDDPDVIYIERAPEPVGEAVAYPQVVAPPAEPAPAAPGTVPESVHIATQRYLDLGDRAFREGRYGDAIQFYARAVSLSPDEAGLHLVLADALFAAGDYHYAAFSIRRALELEPALAESQVDKHDFYADPAAFDRQLAVLETHVEEDPGDADARLVLALNYLFGKRPAAAVDLLERSVAPSAVLGPDPAAGIVLEAARKAQFGR